VGLIKTSILGWSPRRAVESISEGGVHLASRGDADLWIEWDQILTVERSRSRGCLDFHVRGSKHPLRVRCRRGSRESVEFDLRRHGARVVDCWGSIIVPTHLDFEEELAREPVGMRQSSDSA
jgi:hypothetical protein